MCVNMIVCIKAHLKRTVIPTAQLFCGKCCYPALDRKESRHLFVRGPRLSGRRLTISSWCLVPGSEPVVLRAAARVAFLGAASLEPSSHLLWACCNGQGSSPSGPQHPLLLLGWDPVSSCHLRLDSEVLPDLTFFYLVREATDIC